MVKIKDFDVFTNQELSEVKGGTWFEDAIDWIGEKLSDICKWMKEYGKKDGTPGLEIPF